MCLGGYSSVLVRRETSNGLSPCKVTSLYRPTNCSSLMRCAWIQMQFSSRSPRLYRLYFQ